MSSSNSNKTIIGSDVQNQQQEISDVVMSQHEQEARRRVFNCSPPMVSTADLPTLPPLPCSLLLGSGNDNGDNDDENSSPIQDVIDILDEVEMILDTPPVLGSSSLLSSPGSSYASKSSSSSTSSNVNGYMFGGLKQWIVRKNYRKLQKLSYAIAIIKYILEN